MNGKPDPIQIGRNLYKARQAHGWSQQYLAERLSTSPQNISKYEKNGLDSHATIIQLENILGMNISEEAKDIEGTCGEVGREILRVLLTYKGYIDVDDLKKDHMFGMSEKAVSEEIIKLSQLGLCSRELYTDFYGNKCDVIFITAKGVIAYKNSTTGTIDKQETLKLISEVRTYENLLSYTDDEGKEQTRYSYQEVIDESKAEKLIRLLKVRSSYRYDYIKFLKTYYVKEPVSKNTLEEDLLFAGDGKERLEVKNKVALNGCCVNEKKENITCKFSSNLHYDIIRNIAKNIDNEKIDSWIENDADSSVHNDEVDEICSYPNGIPSISERRVASEAEIDQYPSEYAVLFCNIDKINRWQKSILNRFKSNFGEEVSSEVPNSFREAPTGDFYKYENQSQLYLLQQAQLLENCYNDCNPYIKEYIKQLNEQSLALKEIEDSFDELCAKAEDEDFKGELEKFLESGLPPFKYELQITDEDIRNYIAKNVHPAVTAEEKEIDRILAKINSLNPETLNYYYMVPIEWEKENGIAHIIREMYNIPEIEYDADNHCFVKNI